MSKYLVDNTCVVIRLDVPVSLFIRSVIYSPQASGRQGPLKNIYVIHQPKRRVGTSHRHSSYKNNYNVLFIYSTHRRGLDERPPGRPLPTTTVRVRLRHGKGPL